MLWLLISLGTLCAAAVVDNVRLRLRWRAHMEAQAQEALARLGGFVLVDRYELPSPLSDRWTTSEYIFSGVNGGLVTEQTCYSIGEVFINPRTLGVYIGSGPALPDTPEMGKYAHEVALQYRNRIARKSVENG